MIVSEAGCNFLSGQSYMFIQGWDLGSAGSLSFLVVGGNPVLLKLVVLFMVEATASGGHHSLSKVFVEDFHFM